MLDIENTPIETPGVKLVSNIVMNVLTRKKFSSGTLILVGRYRSAEIPLPGSTISLNNHPPLIVVKTIYSQVASDGPDTVLNPPRLEPSLVTRPMLPGIRGLLCRINTWLRA